MKNEFQSNPHNQESMKIHETQKSVNMYTEQMNPATHEIETMQRITGIGTPKKVHLSDMPKPIRIFGYFFIGSVVAMFIFGILIQWIK